MAYASKDHLKPLLIPELRYESTSEAIRKTRFVHYRQHKTDRFLRSDWPLEVRRILYKLAHQSHRPCSLFWSSYAKVSKIQQAGR